MTNTQESVFTDLLQASTLRLVEKSTAHTETPRNRNGKDEPASSSFQGNHHNNTEN